jgi:hypothetical protein
MCFSATASITAGIVLGGIGLATVAKVDSPGKRMLAFIPLLFSIQQFSEGLVWNALMYEKYAEWLTPATYVFLFFAQAVWPVYISGSIWSAEVQPRNRKRLFPLFILGIVVSSFLLFCLFFYPVQASIGAGQHIFYELKYPAYAILLMKIFYFIPTFVPAFLSSDRKMFNIGIVLVVSYAISRLVYEQFVISVWCFFATTVCLAVVYVIYPSTKKALPGYLRNESKYNS